MLALVLGGSCLLDGPSIDDHSMERAQADSLSDALKTEAARIKRTQTISAWCGANAGWIELGGGPARCTLKNGKPTGLVVMVAP